VFGFDIDTTGFENICPTHALIEGLKTPIEENNEEVNQWITLVDTESITPNSHNFFQKNNSDKVLYSHVRLTISPGGGIARFRTYGDVVPYYLNPETEYNLASASLGARIVHWTDTKSFNEPNVLLDKGTLINDFIVIQLAVPGSLNSIIIDTTGFKGISPLQVRVEGCDSKEDDPYLDLYTQWFSLVPKSSIKEDALNTFEVPYTDTVSHVRLTLLPDGGLQQIKCLG
ncbi:galactose-binding domain-like protein, partial [Pilaira anomala]